MSGTDLTDEQMVATLALLGWVPCTYAGTNAYYVCNPSKGLCIGVHAHPSRVRGAWVSSGKPEELMESDWSWPMPAQCLHELFNFAMEQRYVRD